MIDGENTRNLRRQMSAAELAEAQRATILGVFWLAVGVLLIALSAVLLWRDPTFDKWKLAPMGLGAVSMAVGSHLISAKRLKAAIADLKEEALSLRKRQ
ncbi:MAG: hypothetical protein ACRENP_21070 [Longimicrobiales bacterium]